MKVKREDGLQRDRDHASSACRARRSCTSPARSAAFVRAGIPIIDALEVVEEGIGQQALPGRSSHEMRRAAARRRHRSPTRSPRTRAVFPPYYLGILRSAELTGQLDTVARPARRLHRARPRVDASKLKSALDVPGRDRWSPRSPSSCSWCVRAAEVHDVLQGVRRQAAAADARMLLDDLRLLHAELVVHAAGHRAVDRRRSSVDRRRNAAALIATGSSCACRLIGDDRALRGRRAVLPDRRRR